MSNEPGAATVSEATSGVRVITEAVPSVRSVALGLWVRTGSRDETPAQAGVSHFLEHLLFKGTADLTAIEISERFDGLGASFNAATGKESTHLHARFLDDHTDEVFSLLGEMLLRPTFPDVDSEREVVLEEIAMYEDEPSDRVHDYLAEAVFGDSPLGRRILGQAEVVSGIPVPDIAAFHARRYTAGNLVIAAAGNVDHAEILELAESLDPAPGDCHRIDPADPLPGGQFVFAEKDTEQYHVCFGAPGIPRGDERRFALAVLDSILGGSSSSRLFREVREDRGLAYAVGTYSDQYTDTGLVAAYVGTREDNVEQACEVIAGELERIRSEPVSPEELARGKEHVKGRLVLAGESSAARMGRIARALLHGLPILTVDEMLRRVDRVEIDDLTALAAELFAQPRMSTAAVGRDRERFRSAAQPISGGLAA
ncbi:MAG: insulinase family protein [Solirubrobacterales bacterium]|nr:insulinase family protein [Solirubrobacterales bacterium]